jgi:hypothetical protein
LWDKSFDRCSVRCVRFSIELLSGINNNWLLHPFKTLRKVNGQGHCFNGLPIAKDREPPCFERLLVLNTCLHVMSAILTSDDTKIFHIKSKQIFYVGKTIKFYSKFDIFIIMLHRSSDPILRASYPSAIRRVGIQTRGAKNTVVHHTSECNRLKR